MAHGNCITCKWINILGNYQQCYGLGMTIVISFVVSDIQTVVSEVKNVNYFVSIKLTNHSFEKFCTRSNWLSSKIYLFTEN